MNQLKIKSTLMKLVKGDIVTAGTEAIVNAANEDLAPGAGICGAIYAAAGRKLEEQTNQIGGCPTGQARITPSFNIARPTSYVIHAVGPRFHSYPEGKAQALLAGAYRSSLELAAENNLKTIAFPSISTGIFGYPLEKAAMVALRTVVAYLLETPTSLKEVQFIMWDDEMLKIYQKALPKSGESIYFYDKEDDYYEFTNFAKLSFELDGLTWPTSEHYFQAQKFKGSLLYERIRQAQYPSEALRISREGQLPADWHQIKDNVMRRAVLAKFQANPTLRQQLLDTGDKLLVEDSPVDDYWGIGKDGKGQNMLGLILMETREKLRA